MVLLDLFGSLAIASAISISCTESDPTFRTSCLERFPQALVFFSELNRVSSEWSGENYT
jgi:hypothetical protein